MKTLNPLLGVCCLLYALGASACTPTLYLWPTGRDSTTPNASASAAVANPAAAFCEQNTGQHVIQTNAQGAQAGYCLFTDRSYCESWKYFNGECKPGDQPNGDRILLPTVLPTPSPTPAS
jgi:putative hemolysin